MRNAVSSFATKAKHAWSAMVADVALRATTKDETGSMVEYIELDEAVRSGMTKEAFLGLIDRKKPLIFEALAAKYSESHAKLLTLKIVNLMVGKYHYVNRHTTVASRPIQLMIDPANSCQLSCPGCVHTSNPSCLSHSAQYWPSGMLSYEQYENIMRQYGPFAFSAVLYNYGEPLLNALTPKFISLARQYLLFTSLSTNLSLPKIDAESIVTSGLNHMIISIDGVTQTTYEQYRRGGKLELVLENLRKLVEAKKRSGLTTPYLVWQFLTFDHNVHEVDAAMEMAKDMGVDAIQILTPFAVNWDDPSIRVVKSPKEGYHHFTPWQARFDSMTEPLSGLVSGQEIDSFLCESLVARMSKIGGVDEVSRRGRSRCGWLYKNISVDGLGRIIPCCCSPSNDRNLVLGNFKDNQYDHWNSKEYVLSRLALSDKKGFLQNSSANASYCGTCTAVSEPPNDLWWVADVLPSLDKDGVISTSTIKLLTSWI